MALKSKMALIVAICLATAVLQARGQTVLYPFKNKIARNTPTATPREVRLGKRLYQVYSLARSPKTELFRVEIGDFTSGDLVKTWNYGIGAEADLNCDGQEDYLWYGGDDTGESYLLFLSNAGKYNRIDVIKSTQAAWRTRFHKPAPDLADLGGSFHIAKITWNTSEKSLSVTVLSDTEKTTKKIVFRIPQREYRR